MVARAPGQALRATAAQPYSLVFTSTSVKPAAMRRSCSDAGSTGL